MKLVSKGIEVGGVKITGFNAPQATMTWGKKGTNTRDAIPGILDPLGAYNGWMGLMVVLG